MKLKVRGLSRIAGMATLGVVSLGAADASACGGLFCSQTNPVNQAAERILFAQDDEGNVTQIVEIMYEGDAEAFAWVLPVPGTPTPGVSTTTVFDRLQSATNPTYQLNNVMPDRCGLTGSGFNSVDSATAVSGSFGPEGPPVFVEDSGSVGPFDYVTISVDPDSSDPTEVALDWLTENGYDLTSNSADVLGPYLANGLNLIAFRLQKDVDAGSIRPITLEYQARTVSIPILPTAVAAADNMPIMVWVLGSSRAVPTNYAGLELNELLIDWTNPGPTYDDVVNAAADEAGGQGFVTEFSGDAEAFASVVNPDSDSFDPSVVNGSNLEHNLEDLTRAYGGREGFADAVRETVPLSEGVTAEALIGCVSCYFGTGVGRIDDSDPIYETDVSELLEAVERHVFEPIEAVAELFRRAKKVTRLYTTMSAEEMTMDPVFELNPDVGDVSNQHNATREVTCEGASDDWKATLPGGQVVYGNGFEWPYSAGSTGMPANSRVFQYSDAGAPVTTTDNRSAISEVHESNAAGTGKKNALKGCALVPGPAEPGNFWWLAAAAGLGLSVRRRSRAVARVRS